MNIEEAKQELIRTIRAYTAKDENGEYWIPTERQRPVFLLGPPGIGKTAVMEQAAKACGVGILSYTITHHTRQSAVGLPTLVEREFEGRRFTMTEYTMSEIIGAVYAYQAETGFHEGILFLDEINCVSETLAPTMLQFLQFKKFGNHSVPEGWIIAAAGNPPGFNRSARELDLAVLDRVRTLEIEADWTVFRDYAAAEALHPAILSYLEMHPAHFYRVEDTRQKRSFVTARGWEDLSAVLKEYERQRLEGSELLIGEVVRDPEIAADFTAYYELYRYTVGLYRLPDLLEGRLTQEEEEQLFMKLGQASPDIRCMLVRHFLLAASEKLSAFGKAARYERRKKEVAEQLASYKKEHREAETEEFFRQRARALKIRKEYGLLQSGEERQELRIDRELREAVLGGSGKLSGEKTIRSQEVQELLTRSEGYLLRAFGKGPELADWLHGISCHRECRESGFVPASGWEAVSRKARREKLKEQIRQMEEFYETDDRI